MATPKPLEAQQETLQEILKSKELTPLKYDALLEENGIYPLLDCNNQEFYLIPKVAIQKLREEFKQLENAKYLFKLEQEIYKSMPVDFDDVWCIALQEIKHDKKEPSRVVKHLKKRYPYLFLSFLDKLNSQ